MENSKYRVILEDLERKLAEGSLCAGDPLPTENEFVQTYGVSRTTVQRALNILVSKGVISRVPGRGSFVSKNFQPESKREDAEYSGGNYAIILPNQSPSIVQYLVGAQNYFESHNANLTVRISPGNYHSEISTIANLLKEEIDGILIFPSDSTDPELYYRQLAYESKPVILLDKQINGANLCTVASDNYMIGCMVADRFLKGGYTEYAYATVEFGAGSTAITRFRGYADSLRKNALSFNRDNLILLPKENALKEECFMEYFRKMQGRQIALFCVYDGVAFYAYRAAERLGLRIPEDVAIIGCDNMDISKMLSPMLTTVEQHCIRIGAAAARLAMMKANQPDFPITNIQIPTTFVERDSV